MNRYYYTSNDNAYKLAWARALLELISESDIKGVEIDQENIIDFYSGDILIKRILH